MSRPDSFEGVLVTASVNVTKHAAGRATVYVWLAARSRNALRHWAMISIVVGASFIAILLGLVLIPRQTTRVTRIAAHIGPRPDSQAIVSMRDQASAQIAWADSGLVRLRRTARSSAVPVVVDTLSPELRAERDSLTALLTSLNEAMARAAEAPLPPSFRALGETPALHDNPQVKVWLDSLAQVDKLRAPFGALGAGDPIYVALTARVNEIGRSIRDAATMRRSELRSRLAPLQAAPALAPPQDSTQVSPASPAPLDTMPLVTQRGAALAVYSRALRGLDSIRAINARIDTASTEARELANIGAPPAAMLTAALVMALAFGFTVIFVKEARQPTIANVREAEAVAGARVLAVIRPTEIVERGRRQADVDAPPLIDTISESYRTLYLHLAATDASVPIVTVTGDMVPIVATVAANLSAAAAFEARSTLLVDADPATNAIASVLRLKSDPGLTGIVTERASLSDAIVSTTIGRDRPLDVLPSGTGRMPGSAPKISDIRDELQRLERRYDFIVMAAPTSYVQLPTNTVVPAADVIVCARIADTPLDELRAAVKSLRGVGRYVHGIVLWDDDLPRIGASR